MRGCMLLYLGTLPFLLVPRSTADQFDRGENYSRALDHHVFVMMPGYCKEEIQTVVMTRAAYDAAIEERRKEREASAAVPPTEDCAELQRRIGGPGSASGSADAMNVSMLTLRWTLAEPMKNADGQVYPASGLYPKQGPPEPVWTVDWYARDTHLTRDGRHLVRVDSRPTSEDSLGLAFYEDGRLLKTYRVRELVEQLETLPRSMSSMRWYRLAELDEEQPLLRLLNLNEEYLEFDVTTGELVHREKIALPSVAATVETSSGTRFALQNFHTKEGPSLMTMIEQYGNGVRLFLSGTVQTGEDPDTGSTYHQSMGWPFSDIASVTRAASTNPNSLYWTVHLRSGESHTLCVQRGPPGLIYEGQDASGQVVTVPATDIQTLEFPPPETGDPEEP